MSNIIKQEMTLRAITPFHISKGSEDSKLSSIDYVYDYKKNTLHIIDKNKFINFLDKKNRIDIFIKTISTPTNNSKNNKKLNLYNFLKDQNLLSYLNEFTNSEIKNINIKNEKGKTTNVLNNIKLFTKDIYQKPYIPGSSLKGAIVNSLLVDYILKNPDKFTNEKNKILQLCNKEFSERIQKDIKDIISKISDSILYFSKINNTKVKHFGLSVSDTYSSDNVRLAFLQDYDMKRTTNKEQSMPIYREYVMPESIFTFSINLDIDILEKTKLTIRSTDDILDAIENASSYLTEDVFEFENPEYDLFLGANTGYNQKTIIYALFKDKQERNNVTKKMLHSFSKHNNNNANMKNHLNDKISPIVINKIKLQDFDLAGLVEIRNFGQVKKLGNDRR